MGKTAIIMMILLLVAAGCCLGQVPVIVRETSDNVVCREGDGTEVTVPKRPRRVVICYASLVGAWYAAGGEAVAIPRVISGEVLPEAARNVTNIGGFNNPNLEKILLLRPDLVLLAGRVEKHRAIREILTRSGIATLTVDYDNYSDFQRLLEIFCRINGGSVGDIPAAARIVAGVDSVVTRSRKLPPVRFLTLFAGRGVVAETSSGNTSRMAEMLGGENIVKSGTGGSVRFSMEKVMLSDPDLILVVTMGDQMRVVERLRAGIMGDPLWGGLRAVKSGRVYFLPNELFLYRANERFPEAFRMLAAVMYPQEKWE